MSQTVELQTEQQEQVRLLLQEKDQYREQVRKLTEQSDKLELHLLRSQGEVLQLRTRLRRLTCDAHQVRKRGVDAGACGGRLTLLFIFSVRGAARKRSRRQRSPPTVSPAHDTSSITSPPIDVGLTSPSQTSRHLCGTSASKRVCKHANV